MLASHDALDRPGRPNEWIHCIYLNETWHSGRTSAQDKLVTFRMKRGLVSGLAKKMAEQCNSVSFILKCSGTHTHTQ